MKKARWVKGQFAAWDSASLVLHDPSAYVHRPSWGHLCRLPFCPTTRAVSASTKTQRGDHEKTRPISKYVLGHGRQGLSFFPVVKRLKIENRKNGPLGSYPGASKSLRFRRHLALFLRLPILSSSCRRVEPLLASRECNGSPTTRVGMPWSRSGTIVDCS